MMLETGGNMKFKVGDKVKNCGFGVTGEILYHDNKYGYDRYLVGFRDLHGHNGESADSKELYLKIVQKGYEKHCFWLLEEEIELVQEDNKMEDVRRLLKNGDVCVLRDGRNFIVMFNYCGCDILKELDGGDWMDLSDRGVDLLSVADECFDVIEIKRKNLPVGRLDDMSLYETIWKREEVKEMTMEELEKVLGYKVKIKAKE